LPAIQCMKAGGEPIRGYACSPVTPSGAPGAPGREGRDNGAVNQGGCRGAQIWQRNAGGCAVPTAAPAGYGKSRGMRCR